MIKNDEITILGEWGWFIGRTDGILYKLNMDRFEIDPIWNLSDDSKETYRLYQKCIVFDEYVVCLPDNASSIGIYNINQDSKRKVNLGLDGKRICMVNGWAHNGILWGVSYVENSILIMNLKTFQVRWVSIPNSKIGYKCAFDENETIYLPCQNETKIILFNIKNETFKEIEIGINDKGFNTVTIIDRERILLTGYNKQLYFIENFQYEIIDIDHNYFEIIQDVEEQKYPLFFNCKLFNGTIYIFAWNAGNEKCHDVLCFDINSKKIDGLFLKMSGCLLQESWFIFGGAGNDSIFFLEDSEDTAKEIDISYYEYNTKLKELQKKDITFNSLSDNGDLLFRPGKITTEKEGQLDFFIKSICK